MTWNDERAPNAFGVIDPAFAAVADAFAASFERGEETAASFAVYQNGKAVVDINGGWRDRGKETPWAADSLACIYSTGKAVMTMLVATEVSRGTLDYDAPVATYWPEFAANGKEAITLGQLMSHQGGLCGFPDEMSPALWVEWDAIIEKLQAMAPLWTPGTANGYHPQTIGHLVGEVLRRVTGKTVTQLVEDLRAREGVEIYCGLGAEEFARTSYMPKPPKAPDLGELNEYTVLAFSKPWSAPSKVTKEEWAACQMPASNMHANAKALAAIMHPLANDGVCVAGNRILQAEAIEQCIAERCRRDDLVLPFNLSWSAGLMRNVNGHFGPNPNALGHAGFGGSCVMIDPDHNLSVGYVMTQMGPDLVGDPRAVALIQAVYDCL